MIFTCTEPGKIHLVALNGNKKSIKDKTKIQRIITKKEETTLHNLFLA